MERDHLILINERKDMDSVPSSGLEPVRKVFSKVLHFRLGDVSNIRLVRIPSGVILMIFLGDIECRQRLERCDDWVVKHPCFIQLPDISFRNSLLLVIRIENGGSILPAEIVPLPVE